MRNDRRTPIKQIKAHQLIIGRVDVRELGGESDGCVRLEYFFAVPRISQRRDFVETDVEIERFLWEELDGLIDRGVR